MGTLPTGFEYDIVFTQRTKTMGTSTGFGIQITYQQYSNTKTNASCIVVNDIKYKDSTYNDTSGDSWVQPYVNNALTGMFGLHLNNNPLRDSNGDVILKWARPNYTFNKLSTTKYYSITISGDGVPLPHYTNGLIHEDDGTATINVEAYFAAVRCYNRTTSTIYIHPSASTITLQGIPHASTVSAPDTIIGNTCNIAITRNNSNCTHKLEYSLDNETFTEIASDVQTSCAWNIPTSFYDSLGETDKSLTYYIRCTTYYTYSGETLELGSTTTEAVAKYDPYAKAEISLALVNENPQTDLTGSADVIIQNYSNVSYTITATSTTHSNITDYTEQNEATSITSSTGLFQQVKSNEFITTVKDSRDVSTTITTSMTMIPWFKPSISYLNVDCPDPQTSETDIYVSGIFYHSYFNPTDESNINDAHFEYRYRNVSDEGEWSDWVEIENKTIKDNAISSMCSPVLDYLKKWEIQLKIVDDLAYEESEIQTVLTLPVFDWDKDDFNFNVDVKMQSNLDVVDTITCNTITCNGTISGNYSYPVKYEYTFTDDNGYFYVYKVGQIVYFRNELRVSTQTTTLSDLIPEGYRPKFEVKTPVVFSALVGSPSDYGYMTITTSGEITIYQSDDNDVDAVGDCTYILA